jgi:hypothetical protein
LIKQADHTVSNNSVSKHFSHIQGRVFLYLIKGALMERRPQRRPALRHGVAAIVAVGLGGGTGAAATLSQANTRTTNKAVYSAPPAPGTQLLENCRDQGLLDKSLVCTKLGNILLSFDQIPIPKPDSLAPVGADFKSQSLIAEENIKLKIIADQNNSEATPAPAAVAKPVENAPATTTTTTTTPAPKVTPTTTAVAQSTAVSGGVALQTWLYDLRMCESGGNYQENTGNGYYGAYQFAAITWSHWNTVYAYASEAPPGVQDAAIIENTNASVGGLATQNPGCYAKEHLSQFPPSS